MTPVPSILSLSASSIYGLVLLACIAAAVTAKGQRQPPAHVRLWLLLAVFFFALAVLRVFAVEEWLRDSLRAWLRESGSYRYRRAIQAPLAAGLVCILAAAAGWYLFAWARRLRGRRNVIQAICLLAALVMLFLIPLRLTSFHAVDTLLYGPLKLNWVLDLGASLAVLGGAVQYIRVVRARP
jgi:hypothetical protein